MSAAFDLAIAGLGAMGSAAAYEAARRGLRVIGFDRFAPPHAEGSSHGESRIIREAYFEDPRYVPIVRRAYQRWRALERESGAPLLRETGGLMIGPPECAAVAGACASAVEHELPHEVLDAAAVRARFPAFTLEDGHVAVWEPRAGVLAPEACVAAHLAGAARAGAELRTESPVVAWRAGGDGVEVTTAGGVVRARSLVLASGAWLARLVPELAGTLTVARQPLFWFEPRGDASRLEPRRCPIWIAEWSPGRWIYGFPLAGGEVKVAVHGEGSATDPDRVERALGDDEIAFLRERLAALLPDAAGRFSRGTVCMYTNTPDGHFVVDRHPGHPNVIVVSACSGHGFKFASAIGEIAVDLALGEAPRFDLGLFRWRTA